MNADDLVAETWRTGPDSAGSGRAGTPGRAPPRSQTAPNERNSSGRQHTSRHAVGQEAHHRRYAPHPPQAGYCDRNGLGRRRRRGAQPGRCSDLAARRRWVHDRQLNVSQPGTRRAKGNIVSRLIDRIINRVTPKATASACSSENYCDGKNLLNRFCCPTTGCQFTVIGHCEPLSCRMNRAVALPPPDLLTP